MPFRNEQRFPQQKIIDDADGISTKKAIINYSAVLLYLSSPLPLPLPPPSFPLLLRHPLPRLFIRSNKYRSLIQVFWITRQPQMKTQFIIQFIIILLPSVRNLFLFFFFDPLFFVFFFAKQRTEIWKKRWKAKKKKRSGSSRKRKEKKWEREMGRGGGFKRNSNKNKK